MNWFARSGDKLLAFLTLASSAISTQATALGLNEHAMAWITLSGALATLAHTIFFPNTQTLLPPPQPQAQVKP